MKYSELDVENHLSDICKLQCFVNAEEIESTFDSKMKVCIWIKRYDFSEVEFVNHLMDFYQIEENHRDILIDSVRSLTLDDLMKLICQYGIREYDRIHTEKSVFWKRFLLELEKKGVDVNQIKPSDEMGGLLRNNLSDFVFALSRISPGSIKSISVSSHPKRQLFMITLISLIVLQIGLLGFGLYVLASILLIPLIIMGVVVFYLQKKSPETTYVNGYVTFQDMIDEIPCRG